VANWTTACWVMATPFGTPVDPDVYITYASCAGSTGALGTLTSTPAGVAPSSTTSNRVSCAGTACRIARSTSSTAASTSASISCIRAVG
jgi:hypothetical protein